MKTKEHLLDGVPELLVLRLLAHEEMYGYQLVSEIQRRSKGAFEFGEGCIYPVLHRLVAQRMLLERQQEVSGRTRRYYRLSATGGGCMTKKWGFKLLLPRSLRNDLISDNSARR